jgi:hypothetical protein
MRTACFLRQRDGIEIFVIAEEREMTEEIGRSGKMCCLCGILQRKEVGKGALKR